MKLRNLLFGTMVACAFVACSNDDDPTPNPNPTPEAGTVNLDISIETKDALVSKAIQSGDEKKINTLAIFVFDAESGDQLAKAWIDNTEKTDPQTSAHFAGLPAGAKVRCAAYANIEEEETEKVTGIEQTLAVSIPADGFKPDALPMVGFTPVNEVLTLVSGKVNEVTVSLERTVSRVDVVSLVFDITQNSKYKEMYKGFQEALFDVDGFSINGVSSSAVTNEADDKCEAFWGGLKVGAFGNTDQTDFYLKGIADFQSNLVGGEASFSQEGESAVILFDKNEAAPLVSFYVLPNQSKKLTQLVLEGKFGYTMENSTVAKSTSYYPVVIARDNNANGGSDLASNGEIASNKVYRISITVAGPGKDIDGKGKPELSVSTEVADYTPIEQKVVVE